MLAAQIAPHSPLVCDEHVHYRVMHASMQRRSKTCMIGMVDREFVNILCFARFPWMYRCLDLNLSVWVCILNVWTCILGVWTCVLDVWICILVSGFVFWMFGLVPQTVFRLRGSGGCS